MRTEDILEREKGISAGYDPIAEESASGNSGKFLLSTLWTQSGTIYVNTGSGQTALSDFTYNKYCPLDSSSGERSVTGCTNTADSQVIYYWMEKGWSFHLQVSSADYFILMSDLETYYLSNVSQVGEGTISQVNKALSVAAPLENGNFIAALNFYCGAKNHSKYGSESTSTSWSVGAFYNGKNADAYRAAGFDSSYFIAREGTYSACATFFDVTDGLTDVGFSILRENLDYGEVVRVGIPGHAIVMDGYRYNSKSKEYEYHLNYGWGIYSSSTRWYTVSELNNEKKAYVKYVMVDLSPDITVKVSNNRKDYYGGSFQRGLERINHIISGKESTTFTFDSALAGKAIALSTSANLNSGVGVKFINLCAALSTTANTLFSSGAMMSFALKNGSMSVKSSSANYVVRETGSSAVSLFLDSSYIYSGCYSSSAAKLDALLKNDSIYAYSDYSAAFYGTVSGSAVIGGSAADTVTLSNGSAIFGDLDLGGGKNRLSIENGSMYYGSFTGAANTLKVNLSIKSAAYQGPMIVLRDSASDAEFRSASGGRLNLALSSPAAGSYSFSLYSGCDAETLKNYSVNVTCNGASYLLDYENRKSEIFSLNYNGTSLDFSYKLKRLAAPAVKASTTAVTNKNVTLTATFSVNTVLKQYSLDKSTWKTYSKALTIKTNGNYYFRGVDAYGSPSSVSVCKVRNIDKVAPAKPTVKASTTAPTNKSVTLTATFSADTAKKQYSLDKSTWKTYSKALTVKANGTYYFRGIDAAGNVSTVLTQKVSNIYPLGDFTNDTLKAAGSKAALKLSSARKISGWVGLGDPKDFIKLEVQKKGRISLDMNAATAKARNAGQIQFSVLDKSGKAVAVSKLDNDTLATKSKVAAGIYYLGVSCANVNKYNTSYTVTAGMLAG